MLGEGVYMSVGHACLEGVCMPGGVAVEGYVWVGHACQGACVARGHEYRVVCMARGACMAVERVWQERQPLQRAVCILLECILVSMFLFLYIIFYVLTK